MLDTATQAVPQVQSSTPMRLPVSCGSVNGRVPRWFCAQTHHHQEHRAFYELIKQGYHAWLPKIATGPLDATVVRVMFPSYLFVEFDPNRDRWRPICSTYGISRLFGAGPERPLPVRVGVIEALKAREQPGTGVYDERIAPPSLEGQTLRLKAGPFEGFEGLCAKSDSARVTVMLSMFGRATEVQAGRDDVVIVAG